MAKFVVGSGSFDMASWDLSDISGGAVTSDGATEVDVTGADGYFDYTLTGTGLGSFDANGFPQSGTITGLTMVHPGKTPMTITGISIAASDFMGFVNANNPSGLETAILSGNDSFFGRAGNDVLLGFGGNDVFNLTKGGNDTASGGDGNDTFSFDAAFTAADTIDGGAGTDKIVLNGDYSAGVTFGSATMTNVELLSLAAGNNYALTFNATSDTAGQSLSVVASALTAANHVVLDGSALAGALRLSAGDGNDTLYGGSGTNTLLGGNGNDTIYGGTGVNIIDDIHGQNTYILSSWNAGDVLKAGADSGTSLVFQGNVTATIGAAQTINLSTANFTAGGNYDITLDSGSGLNGFDAQALNPGDSDTIDASSSTRGIDFFGGRGNDDVTGCSAEANYFDMSDQLSETPGGTDHLTGGTGDDTFKFANSFNTTDTVNGVSGDDELDFQDDAGGTMTFGATTIQNIDDLALSVFSTSTTFVFNDGNVSAGQTMKIDFTGVAQDSVVTVNASAETDGNYNFLLYESGADETYIITAGAGNDTITSTTLTSSTRLDGGAGYDTVILSLDANLVLGKHAFTGIEELDFRGAFTVSTNDDDVAAGQTLVVKIETAYGGFNGSRETDGTFQISGTGGTAYGGAGDETITLSGSSSGRHPTKDFFDGGGGADQLTTNGGIATFIYSAASDSTGANYDTVTNYAAGTADNFRLWFTVTAVDSAVTTGALSTATFDSDLATAIGSSQLGADHAVLFTPDSGTLMGDHFLIVDANGTAGYQAGQDLVILLHNPEGTAFTTADFTT